MAGLVVSPLSPSSTMKRASSPDAMRPRLRLSYQMLCPYRSSSRSGFAMRRPPIEARLERAYLRDAARVPFLAVEARRQERIGDLQRERVPHDPRTEREDVHRVVLDALVRGVMVVAQPGEDAGDLVGGGHYSAHQGVEHDAMNV